MAYFIVFGCGIFTVVIYIYDNVFHDCNSLYIDHTLCCIIMF